MMKKLLALALALVPLLASAQTAPADQPAKPAGEQAATPPTPPPAKAAAPAAPKVTVTPYGFVQASAYFDQNTFTAKDYPGQVARDQIGGAFLMSARYSRFGVKLSLDDGNWTGATLGGEIEFDFKAGQLPTGVSGASVTVPSSAWYNGLVRLRLADVTATWKMPAGSFQILAGQNYGLVNPLFATSITWTADPLFWQAGNAWRRNPQFRLTWASGPELLGLNLAVAMLSPATADSGAPFTNADYGSGNASRMPDLEGRLGINAKLDPVTIAAGVGYSVGKRRVVDLAGTPVLTKPTKDIDGDELGVDVSIGSQFADLKGEWFQQKGRGDVYQEIAAGAGTTANFQKAIESSGYWAQLILKPMPAIWVHGGLGQEEVKKSSLSAANVTAASTRQKNEQIAAGIIVNAGKFWKFGVEGIQTQTTYLDGLKQKGTQVAVSTQLVF
jgi:opacity protein-like surface antigen